MYNENNILTESVAFNKLTDKLYDVKNHSDIDYEKVFHNSKASIVDSEGFRFMGDYTIQLGKISSAAALMLTLVALGWPPMAIPAAILGTISYIQSYFFVEGELWMKYDDYYDYAKKVETLYQTLSNDDGAYIFGPYTFYQTASN